MKKKLEIPEGHYYFSEKDIAHEKMRISQFEAKSKGDDAKFRQLILNRASKCGEAKRARFVSMLKYIGREDLASFISLTMKQLGDK